MYQIWNYPFINFRVSKSLRNLSFYLLFYLGICPFKNSFRVSVFICQRRVIFHIFVLFKLEQLKIRWYIDQNRLGYALLTTFESHQLKIVQVYFPLHVWLGWWKAGVEAWPTVTQSLQIPPSWGCVIWHFSPFPLWPVKRALMGLVPEIECLFLQWQYHFGSQIIAPTNCKSTEKQNLLMSPEGDEKNRWMSS